LPVGIFTLTMAVTALSVFAISGQRQREIAQGETRKSLPGLSAANGNAAYLRSAQRCLPRRSVEASLFRSFVGQLQMESSTSGVNGIGWGMRVAPCRCGGARDARRQRPRGRASHPPAPPSRATAILPAVAMRCR
jgi:CHASE1-domain containing sensor protein